MVRTFFDGSPARATAALLGGSGGRVSAEELARLAELALATALLPAAAPATARARAARAPRSRRTRGRTSVDSLYGETRVASNGGHLTLQMRAGKGAAADLARRHYDAFDVRWRDTVLAPAYPTLVTFALGADGSASRLAMQVNRDLVQGRRRR